MREILYVYTQITVINKLHWKKMRLFEICARTSKLNNEISWKFILTCRNMPQLIESIIIQYRALILL